MKQKKGNWVLAEDEYITAQAKGTKKMEIDLNKEQKNKRL